MIDAYRKYAPGENQISCRTDVSGTDVGRETTEIGEMLLTEYSFTHEFNNGTTGVVARDDSGVYPVITVAVDASEEHDRNQLGRAGQKILEPGERLVPMWFDKRGHLTYWYYTASQIADKASDQARLDRNRERGSVGKPMTEGSRLWRQRTGG